MKGNIHTEILCWALILLAFTSAVFLAETAGKKPDAVIGTISFNGEGRITAKPDMAVVNLGILAEGMELKAVQDLNSQKSKTVTNLLKKEGVTEKDIKTTGYNINSLFSYPQNAAPVFRGYRVEQNLVVIVRDLDKVGSILSRAVIAGVNRVNSLTFTIENPEELRNQARLLAIVKAKKKAEELRVQLGMELGKIINFSESSGNLSAPRYLAMAGEAERRVGDGPAVPAGENEIVINVTITYQIK